ncbi:unnamed protein product, partial [Staurois parvus]
MSCQSAPDPNSFSYSYGPVRGAPRFQLPRGRHRVYSSTAWGAI